MSGWIKIHREIAGHWIFQDAEKFKWWIDMLFLASYEDNKTLVKNQITEIKRGQFIGSISFFMKRWDVSKDRVINFLRLLQSDGMIDKKTDKNVTLITICNYESYQDAPDNLPDSHSDNNPDNLPDNLPDTTKEIKEVKENIDITNYARTRERDVDWDEERERGYVETFKGQGSAIPLSKVVGKTAREIMTLLEIYISSRQLKNLGHRDFMHFVEAFQYAIKNNKISIPAAPVQPKEKKVISGADIFNVY